MQRDNVSGNNIIYGQIVPNWKDRYNLSEKITSNAINMIRYKIFNYNSIVNKFNQLLNIMK